MIAGQDILAHQNLHSAVFPRALKEHGEGRFLDPGRQGQPNIVISRKIASQHPDAPGAVPRRSVIRLHIAGKPFEIVGIYETGSMILDVVIVMDIEMARTVLNEPKDSVSCIYVEGNDPGDNAALAAAIEKAHPGFDARSMNEAQANFGSLDGTDRHVPLDDGQPGSAVGIVGIINTMLMSTTERFVEFGVLRTNGWSQSQHLVARDAGKCLSGLARGLGRLRAGMGWRSVVNQFLSGGIHLGMTPSLLASRHRPVGHHGDSGRTLPRLACRPAHAHGGHSIRIALMPLSIVRS